MADVGDRVSVASSRIGQPPREGTVTAKTGNLLRVRWSTGEESTVVPSVGSLTVLPPGRSRARRAAPKQAAPVKKAAPAKQAAPAKKAAKQAAPPAKKGAKQAAPPAKKGAKQAAPAKKPGAAPVKKSAKKAAKKAR